MTAPRERGQDVPDALIEKAARALDEHTAPPDEGHECCARAVLAAVLPDMIHVHHHDIEKHAESFNEGYETAMAQTLADDPTAAEEWLERHDAGVREQIVRAIWADHARYNRGIEGSKVRLGLARAARIAREVGAR